MDSGLGNNGTSWYEEGYDTAAATTGLPTAGSTFTSQSSPTRRYTMAPSYKANDAILLDSTLTNATLALTTATACSQLSFLEAGGHNGCVFTYVVHHQSGASDTGSSSILDWYNNGTNSAWTANGRVDVQAFTFSSVNGNDPRLYSVEITLANTVSPVTSIDFAYASGIGHGVIMAVSGSSAGMFNPLAVIGFNEDVVVEAGAGHPGSLSGFTTASMDTGITNTLNTWYEVGYDSAAPSTGLPLAGSTFTNVSAPDHTYTLPGSYAANDALLLTSSALAGTLTPSGPAAAKGLSFLCAAGNGAATINYAVQHAAGSSDIGTITVPDWFSYSPVAWFANGRVNLGGRTVNSINSANPCLYSMDVPLQNTTSPVTGVQLKWVAGGNAAFFALSQGSPTLALTGDDFNTNSAMAASVLQQWYNTGGLYNTTGWWNAANCMEALETVAAADNQLQYLGVLSNTFNLNNGGNFLDGYYDDDGWWANAWIRAFDLTGNTNFLNMAKTIFATMTNAWVASSCDGGAVQTVNGTYKNGIVNELFILTAIRLHQRTPGDGGAASYFYWATNAWNWFNQSGMINPQSLVNDGLDSNCANNSGSTFTYEQGVLIGALTDLYKSTGTVSYLNEAAAIAHAVTAHLSAGDVMNEAAPCDPTCGGGDVPEFKGICSRYIAYFYDVSRDQESYELLYFSAHGLWLNDRNAFSQLGMSWAGPVDAADAGRQSSALMAEAALAEPITTNLLFIKGAGNPAFSHSIGRGTGALAWTCGPTNASVSGYMLAGPHAAYLPTGLHAAHFQITADSLSSSAASLAMLSVLEDNGQTVLASAPAPWNAFTQTNSPHDFVLLFTNTIQGDPLEFRIFYNNASGGPDLTATDVAIDGLVNWSAANLTHDIGQLDGLNSWQADPRSAAASGYLSRGPGAANIPAGDYSAIFELKVDNFNYDNATVATISVADLDSGAIVASRNLARGQFPNVLFQPFALSFNAQSGDHYDFRVYWYRNANAPRVTQRGVLLRPGPSAFFTSIQLANGAAQFNFTGVPGRTYSLEAASDISSSEWSVIGHVTVPANLGFAMFSDSPLNTARFYRLSYP
jgi:predicted alpha-1,6-mannanase (GH76 family)